MKVLDQVTAMLDESVRAARLAQAATNQTLGFVQGVGHDVTGASNQVQTAAYVWTWVGVVAFAVMTAKLVQVIVEL